MSESFSFNGQLLEIAEFKTYQMATFLISVLDEWDLNGRFISKEEGEKGCKSIIGFPLVAKLIVNGDGVPTDFGGHEVYKVQNADGSSEYKYGTQPIGSIMDAWIEQRNVPGYDGVRDCIMISAKIWSVRCPEYCAVLNKRHRKGCVSSSWELISDSVEIVSQGKLLKDISFIGNCLLGSNVPGAVPGAGMLQCAEKEDTDDLELAIALSHDSMIGINKSKETEDIKLNESNDILTEPAVQAEVTPDITEADTKQEDKPADNEVSENNAEATDAEKPSAENSEIDELRSQIAEQKDLVSKLTDKLAEMNAQVAALQVYKDKFDEIEQQRIAAEQASAREAIVNMATKTGLVSKEEFESNDTLKACLEKMDEAGVKCVIAERLLASLNKKNPETAEVAAAEVPAAHISDSENENKDAVKDFRAVMKSYIGK